MGPLDLTHAPPRSPQVRVAGVAFMARTIDKMRAELPGGNLGDYHIEGASELVLAAIKVSVDDLRAVVAGASTDDDVAAWLREHADLSDVEGVNRTFLTKRVHSLEPHQIEYFTSEHRTVSRAEIDVMAEALVLDDFRAFAPAAAPA